MKKRYLYPDIMRTAALLLIFVYHFFAEFERRVPGVSMPIFFTEKSGLSCHPVAVAVSLFFMISGGSLMLSSKEGETAVSFYRRRFKSLMIPFYAVFILGFIGTLLFFSERYQGVPLYTILLSVIGMDGYLLEVIPNFYVTGEWFLGCLILLYLCFPLLKKGVEKSPVLTAALTLAAWILLLAFFDVKLFSERDRWFFLRIPEFLCGMYLAKYLKKAGTVSGLAGIVLFTALWIPGIPERFELLQRLFVTAGIYLIFRFIGELIDGKVPVLENCLHFFAKISYEFFLLHHFAILIAAVLWSKRPAGTGLLLLLLAGLFTTCIAAAYVLKRCIARIFT